MVESAFPSEAVQRSHEQNWGGPVRKKGEENGGWIDNYLSIQKNNQDGTIYKIYTVF